MLGQAVAEVVIVDSDSDTDVEEPHSRAGTGSLFR